MFWLLCARLDLAMRWCNLICFPRSAASLRWCCARATRKIFCECSRTNRDAARFQLRAQRVNAYASFSRVAQLLLKLCKLSVACVRAIPGLQTFQAVLNCGVIDILGVHVTVVFCQRWQQLPREELREFLTTSSRAFTSCGGFAL